MGGSDGLAVLWVTDRKIEVQVPALPLLGPWTMQQFILKSKMYINKSAQKWKGKQVQFYNSKTQT